MQSSHWRMDVRYALNFEPWIYEQCSWVLSPSYEEEHWSRGNPQMIIDIYIYKRIFMLSHSTHPLHSPIQVLHLLSECAIIGAKFTLHTLERFCDIPSDRITELLSKAESQSYLTREHSLYRFVHDRVQQAAYSLINERDRPQKHFVVGRHLMNSLSQEDLEKVIISTIFIK